MLLFDTSLNNLPVSGPPGKNRGNKSCFQGRLAQVHPRVDESGMELLTPLFTEDVSHPENCKVFNKVADMAVDEINCVLLYEFAKTTFHGYVTKYQAQNDPVKEAMEAENQKVTRHKCRREDAIFDHSNIPEKDLVTYHDWMSEEDSEPEGYAKCEMEMEKTQAMAEWRKNLLHRLSITGDLGLHDNMGLLEVVQPEW
ncbi:hypothetical protein JB92DRAFT_2830538 [Gautieria morchelliformis]|nr:hypothetical protein JB92DRAFT_2830538 [Gautieria morchelliformis]